MSALSETRPTDRAETVADAEPPRGRGPTRPGDTGSARVVGDPVADPTPTTLKLYAGEWARFVAWCREQGRAALPASSDTLAAYLVDSAPGLSRGTLGRRRSAISATHRQAGLPTPVLDPATLQALRTAAKPRNTAPAPPPTAAGLVRMAAKCPRDLAGLRSWDLDRTTLKYSRAVSSADFRAPSWRPCNTSGRRGSRRQ